MRYFDNDNQIWTESFFLFKNRESKSNQDFEEIETQEKYNEALYYNLE